MDRYRPINTEIFETTDDGWLFQSVSDHLETLLGNDWCPITNIEKLPGVPDVTKHVWYAWSFAAEVGGNGLLDYLVNLNRTTTEVIHTLAALGAIGANDMHSRLTSAVVLSRIEGSDLWLDSESVRLETLCVDPHYTDFQAVDRDIYNEAAKPFSSVVAKFIRKNRAVL